MQNVRNQEVLDALAKRIKSIRLEKEITQEGLAYKSGLTLSQIARIETGKNNATICTLFVIAKALEIEPYELFKFD